MHLIAIHSKWYSLVDEGLKKIGAIKYEDDELLKAVLQMEEDYSIASSKRGYWEIRNLSNNWVAGSIKLHRLNAMRIKITGIRKPFVFQKTNGWNTRFVLLGPENEELLAYVPRINWDTQTHDLILHRNEEYVAMCQPLLILQGLHCTLVALSMMNGGKVPVQLNV